MAAREIKATLALDGEKQFAAAIKDAQRNLRVMRSEVNAEARAFEASGQKMQANEARVKSLRKQQEQQRQIIKALEQAVRESTERYGEASAATDGYRIKLANAKTELEKMEAAEKSLATSTGKATKSVAELKKQLGSDWNTVSNSVSSALRNIGTTAATVFAAVAASAVGTGKTIYGWAEDAAHAADDVLTLALTSGIDTQTLQGWQYAAKFLDVNVETILGSVKKLRKNMVSNSDDIKDAFYQTGVSLYDTTTGQYRDAIDVFWDIVDELHANETKYGNETVMDTLMQTLFGTGYDDLLPLIKAGRAEWDKVAQEAVDKDIVMDEETLKDFGSFNDTLDKIGANFGAIHNSIAALFLPDIAGAADNVEKLSSTFNQFLNGDASAEDVVARAEETVKGIIESVEHGVQAANEVIAGLQASEDPTVKAIGDALASVRDAAMGIYDHRQELIDGFKMVIAGWAALKIGSLATNIASLAGSLFSLVAGGMALAGKAATIGSAVETITESVPGAEVTPTPGTGILPVMGAAVLAGRTAIWAKMQEEKAAQLVAESTGDPNMAYEVKEPGSAASMYFAKAIMSGVDGIKDFFAGVFGGSQEETNIDASEAIQDIRDWIALSNEYDRTFDDPTVTDDVFGAIEDAMNAIAAKYGGDPLHNTAEGRAYMDRMKTLGIGMENGLPEYDAIMNFTPADDTQANIQGALNGMHFSAAVQMIPVMAGFAAGDFRSNFSYGVQSFGDVNANVNVMLDGRVLGNAVAPIINQNLARGLRGRV